jgi:ABC-type branched-subunit amino acid transport system substrate-binding protein
LGSYVAGNLTLDSVAIIYPDDANGRKAYSDFKTALENRGTEVFFERGFPPNSADFRDILLDLKEAVLPDTFDTTIFVNDKGDTLETEEVPVNIRAIYIPANESQLELIIPQIHFYKIHTTFLGGESWSSERIRNMSELSTREVIFADDLLRLPDDREYIYFYNRYERRFGRSPELVATRAFDAANLICAAFEAAGTTPEAVWNYLASGVVTDGVAGEIRFNERHENEAVSIYWLSNGEITREE